MNHSSKASSNSKAVWAADGSSFKTASISTSGSTDSLLVSAMEYLCLIASIIATGTGALGVSPSEVVSGGKYQVCRELVGSDADEGKSSLIGTQEILW